jgi:signal-transduction protein with cAMP-binding, CBS, and nucleotidyltransferase domain
MSVVDARVIMMDIREIIRRSDLEIISGDSMVDDAIERMVTRNVGSVIIKRGSEHEPYGIVTRQDVLFKVIAKGLDPREVRVTDIMSSPVIILNNINLDVKFAAQAMANADVTNLVIFNGGDVYGFLSSTDIIEAIHKELIVKALNRKSKDVSGGC